MNLGRFRRVVGATRSFGASAVLHDVQQRAINRLTQFHILKGVAGVLSDINPPLVEYGKFRAGFTHRDEILANALAEYDMTPGFVEAALARGDECFAVYDGDRLASFSWYSSQPTLITDGLLAHVDPSWIYVYKGFTHPDYRGQRLLGIMLTLALRSFTERGWRGVVGYVRSNNFRSRRALDRAGYRPFGAIYLVRVLGRFVTWSTPGCKPYGVRLERVAARTMVDADS